MTHPFPMVAALGYFLILLVVVLLYMPGDAPFESTVIMLLYMIGLIHLSILTVLLVEVKR